MWVGQVSDGIDIKAVVVSLASSTMTSGISTVVVGLWCTGGSGVVVRFGVGWVNTLRLILTSVKSSRANAS